MFGSAQTPGSASSRRGVEICVESLNEWKIQEISYGGVEQYVKPPEFKDVLTKNALAVNWRNVVGNEASLDVAGESEEEEDCEEKAMETGESAESVQMKENSRIEPVAGPWAAVAKSVHQSLQEVTVLLDSLNVVNSLDYLRPLTIASQQDDHAKTAEQINNSKGFQLCTRKKVLMEASKMMERALSVRQQTGESSTNSNFFKELRKMRENWRVRKVNNATFGDLGYRIYGPKFHPGELFDISQRSSKNPAVYGGNSAHIQVQVPRNLMRRTAIWVSVQLDNQKNAANLFGGRDISYMNMDPECSKNVHWEKSLKWAQESLICRDIFSQLTRESVSQQKICLPTDDVLVIQLFDDILLKIEKKFYPFEEKEIEEEGVAYLNRALREQFLADQCKKPMRNQQFVSLPQTTLPESLDMRGPQGLSIEEINARTTKSSSLLNRLLEISSHYVLVCKTIHALQKHVLEFADPQFQWKWVRSSPIFSMLSVVQVNRGFENLGKLSIHIRITAEEVVVITKEFQQIKCGRDMKLVQNAILLLTANFMLNSVAILSKAYAWQILHANNNALGSGGNPAPTFYACNQPATKALFIQFSTCGQPPIVSMKKRNLPSPTIKKSLGTLETFPEDDEKFHKFNYDSLFEPGASFMRRMDNLLAIFRN